MPIDYSCVWIRCRRVCVCVYDCQAAFSSCEFYRRPVASLPGGWFVGGPKGGRVGWGGVCVGGGEGITIVSGPGGGGSFEPPEPPWLRACIVIFIRRVCD